MVARRVLVIDDDSSITAVTKQVLEEEGFSVEILDTTNRAVVDRAVARFAPDVVLLDSAGAIDYGDSWGIASHLRDATPRPAVLMFTAHAQAILEAETQQTPRSRAAKFTGIVRKPFAMDDLISAVRGARPT